MRNFWLGVAVVAAIIWLGSNAGASNNDQTTLADISWPNCTLNIPAAEFGIVGIDGGLALHPNPCLAKEAGDFKYLSVYVNTGYPGGQRVLKFQSSPHYCSPNNQACLAYNYGYNSALYDINYSLAEAVIAKRWWLDVEVDNSWSNNDKTNRQALQGTLDALSRFITRANIGIYSTAEQWQTITGGWRNGYPVWLATGSNLESAAQTACAAKGFTGGPVVLTQYTPSLDANYICH